MSGYLEVKYPFRSNLGLNPFKSWKRQWCILRPSPTSSGGSLAVYCSEAGSAAGCVELPFGCVVRRAKSRSRPYAFAIFSADEPCKPRVLLASQTFQDAQIWMDKIRSLLNDSKLLDTETTFKDSYSVRVVATDLSRKCGLNGADGTATVTTSGLLVSRARNLGVFVEWKHISSVFLSEENDKNKTCVVCVHSDFSSGGGELKFSSPLATELVAALNRVISDNGRGRKKLSKSEGDLRTAKYGNDEIQRSSWYSGPSEVSLDDMDLIMLKDSKRIPSGQLSRCSGAGDLAPRAALAPASALTSALASAAASTAPHVQPDDPQPAPTHCDDSLSDRRSMASVASGIYEEIPEIPEGQPPPETLYCKMGNDVPDSPIFKMCEVEEEGEGDAFARLEEPTYESVAECVYATMRRTTRRHHHRHHHHPPPLPPRLPYGTLKLAESWNNGGATGGCCHGNVTRHSSLCSLPQCCPHTYSGEKPRSLPRQAFSVFRKRLKSDSRIANSPKSETAKENKDVETKKKKFDFTPTRDIFKNFRVSRKMKNLKINNGLNKGETKSCECLDGSEHVVVTDDRCSKSVECLERNDEFSNDYHADLSIELNDDAIAALSLPQEIVQLILSSGHVTRVRMGEDESEYIPMSPVAPPPLPPPIEQQYITMSPRTNIA